MPATAEAIPSQVLPTSLAWEIGEKSRTIAFEALRFCPTARSALPSLPTRAIRSFRGFPSSATCTPFSYQVKTRPGAGPRRHSFEEPFVVRRDRSDHQGHAAHGLIGRLRARSGQRPHAFMNVSDRPVHLLCTCLPADQDAFFQAVGVPSTVPSTTRRARSSRCASSTSTGKLSATAFVTVSSGVTAVPGRMAYSATKRASGPKSCWRSRHRCLRVPSNEFIGSVPLASPSTPPRPHGLGW